MAKGSCLCGAVKWRADEPLQDMTHCHCSMCRKAHGAAFATYAGTDASGFEWLAGEDEVTWFESSPGFRRGFCRHCGSVAPTPGSEGKWYVPAGCLDDDPGTRPDAHIFFASKAPWHVVNDDLPRFDAYPPGSSAPVIDRPEPSPAVPGRLRGSCLCGAVAYEMTAPLETVHNCHCSRCRKARAAAHTTNGFTAADGLRFVRGEERLVSYKLPEARAFTQVFCRTCGSGMPRINPQRGIVVIPLGSLDDDPGRGADDHIFVGSKAPWYEIGDELPRFEGPPG